MSLEPGVYGHAVGYQATAGELLAAARAQTAEWNIHSPSDTCEPRHKMRAMDQDGCNVSSRACLATRPITGADSAAAESSAVIEFCLVCGASEWIVDRLRRETEDAAIRLVAPWTLGRTYQLAYKRGGAEDGSALGSGEFTYRGLTAAGGTHRFDPAAGGPAICLHQGEITDVR